MNIDFLRSLASIVPTEKVESVGYFSNGSEGADFEAQWCDRCVHQAGGCAVWEAHLLANYDECNNDTSILHMLIPKSKDGLRNMKCRMFIEARR